MRERAYLPAGTDRRVEADVDMKTEGVTKCEASLLNPVQPFIGHHREYIFDLSVYTHTGGDL